MVDPERVERLLVRVADDVSELARSRDRGRELLGDRTALAAAKYHFITAIEGCARIAHHIIASEEWLVAESNADAVRRLGAEGAVGRGTAQAVAGAVGLSRGGSRRTADPRRRRGFRPPSRPALPTAPAARPPLRVPVAVRRGLAPTP